MQFSQGQQPKLPSDHIEDLLNRLAALQEIVNQEEDRLGLIPRNGIHHAKDVVLQTANPDCLHLFQGNPSLSIPIIQKLIDFIFHIIEGPLAIAVQIPRHTDQAFHGVRRDSAFSRLNPLCDPSHQGFSIDSGKLKNAALPLDGFYTHLAPIGLSFPKEKNQNGFRSRRRRVSLKAGKLSLSLGCQGFIVFYNNHLLLREEREGFALIHDLVFRAGFPIQSNPIEFQIFFSNDGRFQLLHRPVH